MAASFSDGSGGDLNKGTVPQAIRVWDIETGKLKQMFTGYGYREYRGGVAFSPDSRLLAGYLAHKMDRKIHLWDISTGKLVQSINTKYLYSFAFGHCNKVLLLAISDELGVSLWDVATGRKIKSLQNARLLHVSPDGGILATAGSNNLIKLWSIEDNRFTLTQELGKLPEGIGSISFSPQGHKLAVSSGDMIIRIWKAETQVFQLVHKVKLRRGRKYSPGDGVFSAGGQMVAAVVGDENIYLIDSETGIVVRTLTNAGSLLSIASDERGKVLATGSADGTIYISGEVPIMPAQRTYSMPAQ